MNLKQWEKITEWPLTVLSVLFIGVYAWQILAEPTGVWNWSAEFVMNVMWAVFALDYVVSIALAPQKWEWFKHHLFDLAVVVLPVIRPLRVLRIISALNALHKTSGMALRGKIVMYVASSLIILLFVGSLAVLDAERYAPGASVKTFGDALWWTFVTITTVGYGDYTPVTAMGRVIAYALMLAGIGLIGTVTATLASWIVDEVNDDEAKETKITREQVERLNTRLDIIERKLDRINGSRITSDDVANRR
ncbi:potassium channel family protein [Bifidobacterium bombi]|uniref:Potassium channel protein n=1 Tax=Bifidobacterium bombi DSM 19703 TaxID=1341695 RepID=A0A080N3B8_9BIFI|nr:potassium channel family protein [Bifidobacterium bombi]KFF31622.1 potassium channel protein [Bifidobacterium bombi DSM 19703]